MNCSAFRKFLAESESAARMQDLPLPWQDHLHVCPACQREWRFHQGVFAALERAPELAPSPAFTAAVMDKLPAAPLKKRRFDFDTMLMLVLIPAALAAFWYSLRAFWPHAISSEKLQAIYAVLEQMGRDFLQVTFGKMPEVMIHAFGREMMAQAGQVIFISVVTFLVAKSAVVLEGRIRRMFNA